MIRYLVLHHTGRGELWQQGASRWHWNGLYNHYAEGGKVQYLITPERADFVMLAEIHQVSEPGAGFSQAVSSRRLAEQVDANLTDAQTVAWVQQCEALGLPYQVTSFDGPRHIIESWPIYQGDSIPNSPTVAHVEVVSRPDRPVHDPSAFSYAVSAVAELWQDLGRPQIYTHAVLEPTTRITAKGFAWDPPTSFVQDVMDATVYREDTQDDADVAWPAEVEARLVALEKRVARLEGRA